MILYFHYIVVYMSGDSYSVRTVGVYVMVPTSTEESLQW